jgi:hypothetical protein
MKKIEEIVKRPVVLGVLAGLVGIILGLLWGWYLQPVQWTDASPAMLHSSYQEDYLRMAIDSYGKVPDQSLALRRYQALGEAGPSLMATIASNPGSQNPEVILSFVRAVQPQGATPTPSGGGGQAQGSGGASVLSYVLIAAGVLAVGAVAFFLIRLMRPLVKKGGELTPAQQAQQIDREASKTPTELVAASEEQPVFHMFTTYVVGDELYNQFFEINSAEGTYIGQCGVEISDTIPVFEKPKRVRGIGVWLFSVKHNETTTAILMTPDGYNKEALREQLQKKGEPIMVEPNQVVEIETRALKMHVRVSEVKYGQGTSEEETYFNRLTLELAAWPKIVAPE